MFTSVSIYYLMTFLIFYAYCGYLIILHMLSLFGKQINGYEEITSFPSLTILVPCYNEEVLVESKVINFEKVDYPKEKMKVVFLDGGSEDDTFKKLQRFTIGHDYIHVVKTSERGKINQLNDYLPQVDSDIVVCTDMDAILKKDVLKRIVHGFQQDPKVGVIGAQVIPQNCSKLETQYWDDQNVLRILESKVHSSSIVIAPCYAFRRNLLLFFPPDCVADDIYISFLANSRGYKVKYIQDAIVYETRTPTNLNELITHKFRKGNAYQIELLRYLYTLPNMLPRWKLIFLTKFLQIIIMPWILIFYALCSLSLSLSGIVYLKIVVVSVGILFISLVITSLLMKQQRRNISTIKGKKSILSLFLITNFILLINGLSFPFYKQSSKYPKVKASE